MSQELVANLARTLGVTLEQAEKLVKQEIARKVAGEKYRKSEAYQKRLEMQKLVRLAMKEVAL